MEKYDETAYLCDPACALILTAISGTSQAALIVPPIDYAIASVEQTKWAVLHAIVSLASYRNASAMKRGANAVAS